jgi:hypothetical protein
MATTKMVIPGNCAKFSRLGWMPFAVRVRELAESGKYKNPFVEAAHEFPTEFKAFRAMEDNPQWDTNAPSKFPFESKIKTHLSAMPANNKDRGKAILLARRDAPEEYKTWVTAGGY